MCYLRALSADWSTDQEKNNFFALNVKKKTEQLFLFSAFVCSRGADRAPWFSQKFIWKENWFALWMKGLMWNKLIIEVKNLLRKKSQKTAFWCTFVDISWNFLMNEFCLRYLKILLFSLTIIWSDFWLVI